MFSRRNAKQQGRQILLLILLVSITTCVANAEITKLDLAVSCADFAYNPESASILAIDNQKGEVIAVSLLDLQANDPKPLATIKVGPSPCSICFKRFGERHFFAVVCSQDSNLYLIEEKITNSSPIPSYELASKISLRKTGIYSVFASLNPEDPNIFYCHGGGSSAYVGAISLQSMQDTTFLLPETMDAAISANGSVIYHRGPRSSSGTNSVLRITPISDDVPTFAKLHSEERPADSALPDPFDLVTAVGTELFSRDLDRSVAKLSFRPLAFFRSKPVIIGMKESVNGPFPTTHTTVELVAASFHSLQLSDATVTLDHAIPKSPMSIPSSDFESRDFKQITYRYRTFADDSRQRVIFADRNKLFVVDLADFKSKDEPLLVSSLPDTVRFVAGKANDYRIQLPDSNVKLNIENLPPGMTLDGTTLHWTPSPEDIGAYPLTAVLSSGDSHKTRQFEVTVDFPSFPLPFEPTGFAIDKTGKKGVIWDGAPMPNTNPSNSFEQPKQIEVQIAVIDLATGRVDAQRKLGNRVSSLLIANELIFIRCESDSTSRCDVFRISDLQRAKSITTAASIQKMAIIGEHLAIQDHRDRIEIYNLPSLELAKVFPKNPGIYYHGIIGEDSPQIFANGLLWGNDLKPELLLASPSIPTLVEERDFSALYFESKFPRITRQRSSNNSEANRERGLLKSLLLTDAKKRIQLHYSNQVEKDKKSNAPTYYESRIYLTLEGTDSTTVLFKRTRNLVSLLSTNPVPTAHLAATAKEAFVAIGRELYRWDFPQQQVVVEAPSTGLSWMPVSTTRSISENGKTELKHDVTGGKPPYSFGLMGKLAGLTIDDKTGIVTVDNSVLHTAAENVVIETVLNSTKIETNSARLRNLASQVLDPATEVLGRRPMGFPVAIPIRIMVTDDNLQNLSINYFVIAEVNSTHLIESIKKLDSPSFPAANGSPPSNRSKNNKEANLPKENRDIERLEARMKQLEERLDLMNRQLTELMQKLGKQDQ